MSKHKRPWSYDDWEGEFLDAGGHAIDPTDDEEASFIVRAVNSHDALVAALTLIAGHGDKTLLGPEWDIEHLHAEGAHKAFADMAEIARDALALAVEKEEAA